MRIGSPLLSEEEAGRGVRAMSDDKEKAKRARAFPETERLLRQFLPDGPTGNSKAFQEGWARTFGAATGEHSGAVRPYEPAHHRGAAAGGIGVALGVGSDAKGYDPDCSLCRKFVETGLLTVEGKPARCDDPFCWCHKDDAGPKETT